MVSFDRDGVHRHHATSGTPPAGPFPGPLLVLRMRMGMVMVSVRAMLILFSSRPVQGSCVFLRQRTPGCSLLDQRVHL